ncbi:MAG TPA: glycosyltransferase family 4 protein [Thermoanaerobaculia bacterium]|jgi:glycosyltransferase involved in cell wall biosynthesis|nr:glycosyltransferase family 4 protein [Thermoanaerobaculia bacterium]
MKIAYLLEDTDLAGGIRVCVAHGDVLTDRGHDVTLITKGTPLTWRRSRAKWLHVESWEEVDAASFDFVVGTFWRTLPHAYALAPDRAIHFCQGYEGSFTAYQPFKAEIEAAYRLPIPKITVSPHLVPICKEFFDDATYVGQIVDDDYFQPHTDNPAPRRVLLVGPMQADFKGIDVGYAAVRRARALGASFDLIRVSQWAPADDEPAELAAEFHVALSTADMVRLIASCDAYLAPSRHQEGFGLPAAEAMASGLPGVLSEIPSFLSWSDEHDYGLFTPEGDGAAMGDALARLLGDPRLRDRIVKRARQVVDQFRAPKTGDRLERFFEEHS